jgi:acyl-CoA synthetase (AMP-forming)/AMP-acid ligase II
MIISGGENIYPVEVETILRTHPAVIEVAVFGVPDERWGECVVAAVELRPDHVLDQLALIAHVRRSLAGYKVPKRITADIALPRTASGKVQRRATRTIFLASQQDRT